MFQELVQKYKDKAYNELGPKHLKELYKSLQNVNPKEIQSTEDGRYYLELLRKFREAVAENDRFHGANYSKLLRSVLAVGEDGLYSNNLRFIFELIQNVDDCDYEKPEFCCLDISFDFNQDQIILTYNETGFTPANVFAITGIAEAAKNISSTKNEIGEKGIGFKSVFGVAEKVWIRSGFFSFELSKKSFTIPVYRQADYCSGTQMVLYVPQKTRIIYQEIKNQYCTKEALFSRNPILFLNKLTSLKICNTNSDRMEFYVSRSDKTHNDRKISIERNIRISLKLSSSDNSVEKEILCTRYSYPVIFSRKACQSRYGEDTLVGSPNGKVMLLRAVFLNPDYISENPECISEKSKELGALYSFLPTQLRLRIPVVCHVPFKLDASREFVDPQGDNLWFKDASLYLSQLLDYAYMDWRYVVKEKIIYYIAGPGQNNGYGIFKSNNGKEDCLREQTCFKGKHFLSLPLFYTTDNKFHCADELFCFNSEENIIEQEKVRRFLGIKKYLFIPPPIIPHIKNINTYKFSVEENIYDRLFRKAFSDRKYTAEILDYLDSVDYTYSEKQVSYIIQNEMHMFPEQIEIIFRHHSLADIFRDKSSRYVQNNMYIKLSLSDSSFQSLQDVLFEDFELGETPHCIEKYMQSCHEKCICLDIGEEDYLPFNNAVVLSKKNPIASFAAFCYAVDQSDTFSIRIKLREASEKLNVYVEEESGSASDYLRNLRNVRLLIKDSLGKFGYRNYIDLILHSGTDRGRFIHEILQNADDCEYYPDSIPSFSLVQTNNTVITEYNEIGFNRANIRSITAIGESTKNKLFDGQLSAIGEKGVGFKTIFAIASEIRIHSGEYHFSLTDREPTIPKTIKHPEQNTVSGTRMEIVMKKNVSFSSYSEKEILEFCLCLRKLHSIKINSHTITIEDKNNRRIITIDKRQHIFRRFTHTFTVTDNEALNERRNGTREITEEQTISCMVPEKGGLSDYALYNGLPTKHRIKIPLVIDAPFALTTSREEIETEYSAWNNIIRRELYAAILNVIDCLKKDERENIFRFMRFVPRFQGNVRIYVNDISDCSYLTSYDYLGILKAHKILPTFDTSTFSIPRKRKTFRFPEAANILFRTLAQSEYAGINPSSIINVESNSYEAALNALECPPASYRQIMPIILKHAEQFIGNDDFRPKLYEMLKDSPAEYKEQLKQLAIIPVYGNSIGGIEYISWRDDGIFVRKGAVTSAVDYYVLNEKLLSKSDCEKIFDVNINEMNAQWERNRYNERLKIILKGSDIESIYRFLLNEYQSGALKKNDSFATLFADSGRVPLKNELSEIVDTGLFVCDQPTGYFPTKMIQRLIAHKECIDFARYLHRDELKIIHYEDIDYYEPLTADDVETLLDDYFINSEEILRGCYKDGLLSDELLKEYNLEYLALSKKSDYGETFQFPSVPAGNRSILRNHIQELWRKPIKVVSVIEERTVKKGQIKKGTYFNLGKDDRDVALRTYSPKGTHNRCFCQMCHTVKPYRLIEVNNIELNPKYYFPQLRISLCLECSKLFEYLRNSPKIREKYIEEIKKAQILSEGTVDIHVGQEYTITFTAKHLAEIQEILRHMPD